MLRFFRQIRQRLLTDNKFSKYLLYAIGEILLVVIGILIALQVNNWNTERQSLDQSLRYLDKLEEEIQLMLKADQDRMPYAKESYEEAMEALRYLESCGEKSELENSFIHTLQFHQTLMKYVEIRNTYDEMIAAGAFSALDDAELKSKIFRAYNILTFGQSQIDYFRDEVGRASAVINSHVSFSYNSNGEVSVSYDVSNLCRNMTFRNAMVEIVDARSDWMSGLDQITSGLEDALESVTAYKK